MLEKRGGSSDLKQGEWMCQQIIRVLNAEHKRDEALRELQASEAQQRRLAEQLAELNRDLERRVMARTAELEIANKHLESFSYSVSHDLRAPLRVIAGFSNILAQDYAEALGEEGRQHLGRVTASARNMGELIEGLLTLSRVVSADLRRAPVDLSALAEEVRREICDAGPGRAAEFVIHSGLRVIGDRALLRAVLSNLIGNAWKFTSKCARARIEIGKREVEEGRTVYFVKDNGAGFEMKYAEKLFGAFQRLHSPSSSTRPCCECVVRASRLAPVVGLRILVVDDEFLINELLIRGLEHNHNWSVVAEREAMVARKRIFSDEKFDIIILDILLPDLNGMVLFREIEEKLPLLAHKVVFITGGLLIPAVEAFLETIDNRVIEKPFTFEEIEEAIAEILGNGAAK